jgi:transposase-like protein
MAGRRTNLTPEIHQRIVAYVRAGAYTWVAARAAGVHPATFYRWMKRGEETPAGPYRAFYDDVEEARAQARVTAEAGAHR